MQVIFGERIDADKVPQALDEAAQPPPNGTIVDLHLNGQHRHDAGDAKEARLIDEDGRALEELLPDALVPLLRVGVRGVRLGAR